MSPGQLTPATLVAHAAPVLAIARMVEPLWTRNVGPNDRRFGPWLTADYRVIDRDAWHRPGPCVYTVTGADGHIRYVGISVNKLTHRWRMSPSREPGTSRDLGARLFHSQCWPWLMAEYATDSTAHFEVRVVSAGTLAALSGYTDPHHQLVRRVELELIGQKSATFAPWNGRQPTGQADLTQR